MNDGPPLLVFTIRPDGTSLWLPQAAADAIGVKHGSRLTPEQYNQHGIQALLEKCREKKAK